MSMNLAVRVLVALPLLLMALSLFAGQPGGLPKVLEWYGLAVSPASTQVVALILLLASLLALAGEKLPSLMRPGSVLLVVLCAIPLLTLLGPQQWIAEEGGFPVIGSGQGIIKYFSLVALALSLMIVRPNLQTQRMIVWLNYLPVALVLLWIGGMKFTQVEAQGIEPLVDTSPLLSWMYQLMDLQTTSNVIGLYDIAALLLLGLGLKFAPLLIPGILMCAAVFLTTQTFLVSFDGSIEAGVLSGGGMFVIKDLWFVANLLLIYHYRQSLYQRHD